MVPMYILYLVTETTGFLEGSVCVLSPYILIGEGGRDLDLGIVGNIYDISDQAYLITNN